MYLIDTHAHLEDETLQPRVVEILENAAQNGVQQIISVGTTRESSRVCLALAEKYPQIVAAVGIHPNYCLEAKPEDWEAIQDWTRSPRVVALGETGLDRYWQKVPLELQREYFVRHLELSASTGLPVIIHMRESGVEILEVLQEVAQRHPLRGVMHSFAGDLALAEACLELGLYLSFAGMVTFKKSDSLREIAARVPDDRILVETDCPYLSPEPFRGKYPNEPARVRHTAECLAQVRGTSLSDFAMLTTQNAKTLFQLGDKQNG